jgi:hypothetical protein
LLRTRFELRAAKYLVHEIDLIKKVEKLTWRFAHASVAGDNNTVQRQRCKGRQRQEIDYFYITDKNLAKVKG